MSSGESGGTGLEGRSEGQEPEGGGKWGATEGAGSIPDQRAGGIPIRCSESA